MAPPVFVGASGNIMNPGFSGFTVTLGSVPAEAGDTLFAAIHMPNSIKDSLVMPGGVAQVNSWVVGEADLYGVPAFGLFKLTDSWDGVTTSYAFTSDTEPGLRGGNWHLSAYEGDATVREIGTGTATDSADPRSSPAITGASGNKLLAFHGGSAADITVNWSGGTERYDAEYYGLNGMADADASGASQQLTVTLSGFTTQSMWIVVEMGPEGGAAVTSLAAHGTGMGHW